MMFVFFALYFQCSAPQLIPRESQHSGHTCGTCDRPAVWLWISPFYADNLIILKAQIEIGNSFYTN